MNVTIPSPRKAHLLCTSALMGAALLIAAPAFAQEATPAAAPDEIETVTVTGFRSSLKSALNVKKNSAATIDSILAEDVGKFPDSNLAESMQRIPGVTLSRGDGGEGRNISVRGLGPQYTRVRLNGMEGAAQSGSADIYGAGNNGRSFDFNIFPSEIFSSLAARKTASADVEEGSLGATVDLRAPKPFDYSKSEVLSFSAKGTYNELAKKTDPRLTLLASKKFADGTFGILGTLTYQEKHTREVGYSAVDILSANTNGYNAIKRDAAGNPIVVNGVTQREVQPFCTPIGWTDPSGGRTISPDPAESAAKGATAANCSTNNPRTGTIAAYNTIYNLRRADAAGIPGSGAFLPRIPRYVNSEQDTERLGGSLTFQWRPDANTDVSLDVLYSKFDVERRDNYIAGLSLARNIGNNGQPMVSVKDVQFKSNGSLLYGLFDGMDVRSEGLVDVFTSEFTQVNLNARHRINERFEVTGFVGKSTSTWDGPMRLQTFIDAIDVDNFSIDFRGGGTTPAINFGIDVSNPANFTYAPGQADGTVTGGFSVQGKPQWNTTDITTINLDGKYDATDSITVKFGLQYRENDFNSRSLNLIPTQVAVTALPAGVTLASLTKQITGVNDLWGNGAPASWVAIDPAKWREAFKFDSLQYCGIECGAPQSQIKETVRSSYIMAEFNSDSWLPVPVRGDVGVRSVYTKQFAVGHIAATAPAGSQYPTRGVRNQVEREYHDILPSANIVFELKPELLARFSAAKVMTRPELGNLTPSSGVTFTTRTGTINNPYLEPIRATTFDAALEWYFRPGSLVSVGYFHKDIKTFIQRINQTVPYNELGLPLELLVGNASGASATDLFNVARFVNTPGGPLKGVELNLQADLDFLPGFWSHFGVLANYTHITSEINYVLSSSPTGVPLTSTTNDLTNLSRESASGTLYWENDKFSVRSTASYRGKYIRAIPASAGSDLQGNDDTLYVDASASYQVTDRLKLSLEAQNLTDEQNRLYIDSNRQDTLFETRIGRTVTFGLTYKY
ncbi:TonB-dependent receptor [Asticcacaulis excentricus]|uniref:TonB-dependent receptor n=1 Tax=Asticcacaulis excentricus (strain ATCC 15261 / DSM 4724 / KCTC 12464 / NCIMB 9791 / VKM B-1370 / CB 48) TaxID=573065 RepID=E8RTJ2_ASTEC|nr:TonB-dependent receptor [Asticcacaulis excentricus]ADU14813.1 TonB-dependent receptor [Asticcacaulis excentricus CB 48]